MKKTQSEIQNLRKQGSWVVVSKDYKNLLGHSTNKSDMASLMKKNKHSRLFSPLTKKVVTKSDMLRFELINEAIWNDKEGNLI